MIFGETKSDRGREGREGREGGEGGREGGRGGFKFIKSNYNGGINFRK